MNRGRARFRSHPLIDYRVRQGADPIYFHRYRITLFEEDRCRAGETDPMGGAGHDDGAGGESLTLTQKLD